MELHVQITTEDLEAGRLLGATVAQVIEAAIHRALDEQGIPREGRAVEVTPDTITIDLPTGTPPPDLSIELTSQ